MVEDFDGQFTEEFFSNVTKEITDYTQLQSCADMLTVYQSNFEACGFDSSGRLGDICKDVIPKILGNQTLDEESTTAQPHVEYETDYSFMTSMMATSSKKELAAEMFGSNLNNNIRQVLKLNSNKK